jgi:hypothetical protein
MILACIPLTSQQHILSFLYTCTWTSSRHIELSSLRTILHSFSPASFPLIAGSVLCRCYCICDRPQNIDCEWVYRRPWCQLVVIPTCCLLPIRLETGLQGTEIRVSLLDAKWMQASVQHHSNNKTCKHQKRRKRDIGRTGTSVWK